MQLILELEQGLTQRYGSLLECIAACVYKDGLKSVAMDLDKAPGNLSRELAGASDRHFSVDNLESYMAKSGNLQPLHYLNAKFMSDATKSEAATLQRLDDLMRDLAAVTGQLKQKKPAKTR